MLARTYRDVAPFDAAVAQLRDYFDRLLGEAAGKTRRKTASAKQATRFALRVRTEMSQSTKGRVSKCAHC